MCILKTLVKFAISHLALAAAGAWTIFDGRCSGSTNLRQMPLKATLPPLLLLGVPKVKEGG